MCGSELAALPEGVQRVARELQDKGHPHAPQMLDDAARTAQQAADALGIEVGHRVGPAFVSVSLADLPIDARQTLAAAGVRVYHGTGLAATYLAAQVGAIRERIREGSPLVVNPFAMLGPGLELALRGGFSATADFLIGAENRGDGPERSWTSSWHLSGLFRLGVGARF